MRFLGRLAAGDIPLWRVFWLLGTPLALIWDASGAGMVFGFGIRQPFLAGFIIAVFGVSSAVLPFVAVCIWRSATNYPRTAWWHTPLAWAAKLSATISGLAAAASFCGLVYLAYLYIAAALAGY